MKRILSLVLILILSVAALTACEFPWDKAPSYDLDNAKGAVVELYPALVATKDNPVPNTIDNYNLTKVLPLKDGTYTIEWNTDNVNVQVKDYVPSEEGDKLSGENTVTVHVPERPEIGEPDITYTLRALITAPDGSTAYVLFNLKVPAMAINTYKEYVEAENGTLLTHEGIITGITRKSEGWSANNVFFQDADGGYYAYNLKDEQVANLQVGMKVQITGKKDLYNGTYELIDVSVKVLDETLNPVAPVDYTSKLLAAESLKDEALVYAQSFLVTIKGVTIAEVGDNGYYYFTIGEHKVYLRVSSSNNPCTKQDTLDLIAAHAANFGNTADVTGLVTLYNGVFYLTPVSADAFNNFVAPERTPAEKVELEKGNLKLPVDIVYEDSTISLPLAGTTATDVVISWTVDNENFTITEDGKLAVTLGEEVVTLTLTATLTHGEGDDVVTDTKTFTLKIDKNTIDWKDTEFAVTETGKLEAGATSTDKFYFVGTVGEIYNSDYCNFYLTDGTNSIVVYGIYDAEGGRYGEKDGFLGTPIKEGDVVYLHGNLCHYVNKSGQVTFEITNAVLLEAPEKGTDIVNPYDATDAVTETGKLEAGATSTDKFYFVGTVGEIYNSDYCNFYLTDGTNSIVVYGIYDAEGGRYGEKDGFLGTPIKEGDVIYLQGKLCHYVNKSGEVTFEITNAVLLNVTGSTETPDQPGEGGGETPEQPGEGGGETPSAPTTVEEILNALYALSDGETLAGEFTLTGKITNLDDWNNPTIVVEGFDSKPVYCFKLKDDRFVVGATITVSATTLKNYKGTYELEGCTLVEIVLPEGTEQPEEGGETPDQPGEGGSDVVVGDSITLDFTVAEGKGTKLDNTTALDLFNKAAGVDVLTSVTVENVYSGNGDGGAFPQSEGFVKMGKSKGDGTLVMNFGDKKVAKVEIKCHDWYKKSADHPTNSNKVSVNGSAEVLAPYTEDGTYGVLTFELDEATNEITIVSNDRIFVLEIVVYFAE